MDVTVVGVAVIEGLLPLEVEALLLFEFPPFFDGSVEFVDAFGEFWILSEVGVAGLSGGFGVVDLFDGVSDPRFEVGGDAGAVVVPLPLRQFEPVGDHLQVSLGSPAFPPT